MPTQGAVPPRADEAAVTESAPSLEARIRAPGDAAIAMRRILWACDFSTGALEALRWVLPIAKAYRSEITALHVIPATVPPGDGILSLANPVLLRPHLHHDVSAALDRYVAPAIAASVPATVTLREGTPIHEILDMAERLPADLVVLGTHGRGALERSVIGSVAEAVLGRARCPVVTVPAQAVPASGAEMPGTVLWATDFSVRATAALPYALSIAAKGGADLIFVHAVEPDPHSHGRERVGEGERRLREVAAANQLPGRRRPECIVVSGSASAEILRVARERGAGLVVMGTHGSRTLHSLLLGSTARRVIRDAPCPVLSLRRT
jgi:nucleotide-binding universal stress UspA family protein